MSDSTRSHDLTLLLLVCSSSATRRHYTREPSAKWEIGIMSNHVAVLAPAQYLSHLDQAKRAGLHLDIDHAGE